MPDSEPAPVPAPGAVRATIEAYLARFSAGDRAGWLDLWADGATMEDPVGSPVRTGRDEIGAFWDAIRATADAVELRSSGPAIVVGNDAAFPLEVRPSTGGTEMVLPAIDVMTFDGDARITSQRAFVDLTMLRPAT